MLKRTIGITGKLLSLVLWLSVLHGCKETLPAVQELPQNSQLPDPFIMLDGTKVETVDAWDNKRRPEIKKLFQHYVYGYLPGAPPQEFDIVKSDSSLFDSNAVYKEVQIKLILAEGKTHIINLALFLPLKARTTYPVFLFANKCGNHTVLDFEGITIIERSWIHQSCLSYYPERGSRSNYWAIKNSINR